MANILILADGVPGDNGSEGFPPIDGNLVAAAVRCVLLAGNRDHKFMIAPHPVLSYMAIAILEGSGIDCEDENNFVRMDLETYPSVHAIVDKLHQLEVDGILVAGGSEDLMKLHAAAIQKNPEAAVLSFSDTGGYAASLENSVTGLDFTAKFSSWIKAMQPDHSRAAP